MPAPGKYPQELRERAVSLVKDVERPKVLPGEVVATMPEEGSPGFNMHHHAQLWKSLDPKRERAGFGVNVAGSWYWYEKWLSVVRAHFADNRSLYC